MDSIVISDNDDDKLERKYNAHDDDDITSQ